MTRPPNGSLRRRVVLSIFVATVAPLAVLGWRSYVTTRRAVEASALNALADATQQTVVGLDAMIGSYVDALRVQAQNPVYVEPTRVAVRREASASGVAMADVMNAMRRVVHVDSLRVQSLALLQLDGRVLAATDGANATREDETWLRRALTETRPVVGTEGDLFGYPTTVVVGTQIRNEKDVPVAILRMRVRVSAIQQVMATVGSVIKRDGIIRLRDSSGGIIAVWPAPRPTSIRPTRLRWDDLPSTITYTDTHTSDEGVRSRVVVHQTGPRTRLREAAVQLELAPWYLSTSIDEAAIVTPAVAQARELLVLASVLAVVIFGLAALAGGALTRRLERLSEVADRFAGGELDARASDVGRDEIGVLGTGFNAMADRLSGVLRTLEARTAQLEEDLLTRERLEDQLSQSRKLEAVGQLAGGVAHDFNNLLTVILSTTQFVSDALGPEHPLLEEMENMESAARRGADMTAQLLTFARRQRVEPRLVDVNEVVRDAERLVRRLLGSRHRVEIHTAAEPCVAVVDPTQFTQVLLNLASNARDAMHDRNGVFRIESQVISAPDSSSVGGVQLPAGEYVVVRVSDSGHGMTAEVRQRVFEPFFTTKRAGQGTGLGLASVFGIIGQANGAIGVESVAGLGTTFHLFLPRAQGTPVSLRLPASGADAVLPRALRILVLDDDPLVLRAVSSPLVQRGMHCATAGDITAGMAAVRAAAFDLVISDIMMPGGIGADMARTIRREFPDLPVLLISGYAPEWPLDSDPITQFLGKPFTTRQLIDAIDRLLATAAERVAND